MDKLDEPKKTFGLCHRCEHRASFRETGRQPRMECGDVNSAKYSCYMYKPMLPFVMAVNEGDERPAYGPAMISARMHAVRVATHEELGLHGCKVTDGILAWYQQLPIIKKKRKTVKPPRSLES